MARNPGLTGLAGVLIRIFLLGHFIASGLYLWLQPRGFEFGSRAFLEQQVVAPAIFGVSAFAVVATYVDMGHVGRAVGILAGFWLPVGTVTLVVGTTVFAVALSLGAATSALVFGCAARLLPGRRGVLYA